MCNNKINELTWCMINILEVIRIAVLYSLQGTYPTNLVNPAILVASNMKVDHTSSKLITSIYYASNSSCGYINSMNVY